MEQYIPKSALVAELKKRIRDYWSNSENTMGIYPYTLEEVIKYIDTLEVKEVGLNEEIESYFKGFGKFPSVSIDDCIDIAKHFFTLGASNLLTWEDILNINDIVNEILKECRNTILYDTEEDFCKEVLRRFRIKKGG